MKKKRFNVTSAAPPDLDAAAAATLPIFLAFLEGRLVKRAEEDAPPPPPVNADEEIRNLPS